jgi:hypothetical protein
MERENASVGSMRRPLIRGKHEGEGAKHTSEGGQEEITEEVKERKEVTFEEEETQAVKEAVKGDNF